LKKTVAFASPSPKTASAERGKASEGAKMVTLSFFEMAEWLG